MGMEACVLSLETYLEEIKRLKKFASVLAIVVTVQYLCIK